MYSMSKPISLYYHWLLTPDTGNKLIPVRAGRAPSSAAISTALSTLSSSMKTTFVYGWVRLRCSYSNTHRFIRVIFVGGLGGYWSCVQHTSCSRAASSVCPEPRMLHSAWQSNSCCCEPGDKSCAMRSLLFEPQVKSKNWSNLYIGR